MKKYVEVDREPVVGDMVKVIQVTNESERRYKLDDILKVVSITNSGLPRYGLNYGEYLYSDEFVVVEEIAQFSKSDLKPCMVVKLRNGELFIVSESKDGLCLAMEFGHMSLKSYNEAILCIGGYKSDSEYDIIEVYSLRDTNYHSNEISTDNRELLFKREEQSPRDIKIKELQDKMDEIKREMEELK